MHYFVRSTDGADYSVGLWNDGEWRPLCKADALRECALLDEPGAYVWGKSRRAR